MDYSEDAPFGRQAPVALGGVVGFLIALTVLAMSSIGAVPPLAYGIIYNTYTKVPHFNRTYTNGRYLVYPWNRFLLFPASVQTVEFTNEPKLPVSGLRYAPLHTRTKEGLALHLRVALQYRLREGSISTLYSQFNNKFEEVFISTIRDVLIKVAAEFEAPMFWKQRQQIGARMQEMIDVALHSLYADCWGLQLMVIELPSHFEDSIVRTQVQKQSKAMRENEQCATKVRAETDVIKAEFDKLVTIIGAHGQANYTLTTKKARAHARQRTIHIETKILGGARTNLGLDPLGLVQYQKFNAMRDLLNSTIMYGFESNTQILVQSPLAR